MTSPSLRLLSRDNGVGLSRDLRLLAAAADPLAIHVDTVGFGSDRRECRWREARLWGRRLIDGRVDLQVFVERIHRRCLPLARRNVLIPNPEWLLEKWMPLLPRFDQVLCKTRHAQRIFDRLGCATRYIGFTSEDRLDATVPRRRAFFHLAGASEAKGTQVLMDIWRRHPQWPTLTVVQSPRTARAVPAAANIDHRIAYLDDAELRRLQNAHRFHICPSETEGFGHYLMEAMSVGAVVLATDAEPMNELVDARRGLPIAARPAGAMRLAQRYRVEAEAIEDAVERALALPGTELQALGASARAFYENGRRGFHARFRAALAELLPAPAVVRADAIRQSH